ncbi:hypothetical protein SAMN04487751_2210 [Microbacterium saccharophilum]|uniref:Uncharacterized protein n=1 Tax=Microbacterium saccharophilum TaxID=1213358 RepID=A0A7Z7CY94_9MICO|nr:hypothetical protein SAMN04487751_2210 [Microbacterium saccharophilum]
MASPNATGPWTGVNPRTAVLGMTHQRAPSRAAIPQR